MGLKGNPGFGKLYDAVNRWPHQPKPREMAIAMVLACDSVELTDLLMPVCAAACQTWAEHHPTPTPRLRIGQHDNQEVEL